MSAFVRGELDPARVRTVVRHLLQGCSDCCTATAEALGFGVSSAHASRYDAPLDQALITARKHQRKRSTEKKKVQEIAAKLKAEGLAGIESLPAADRGLALVEALLERSWALRHEDPGSMVAFARRATDVARALNARGLGTKRLSDLKARAHAELANSLRVAEKLPEAESEFAVAYAHFLEGTDEPLLLARILDLHASLFRARRQFNLARNTLWLAHSIYKRYGQKHLAGRTLINIGIFVGYSGESERATHLLTEGFRLIDQKRDPELAAMAIHNQIWFLVECHRYEEAQRLLFLNRVRFKNASRLHRIKLRWLEGRIDTGIGKLQRAETIFEEVRSGFKEAGQHYPAAIAGLDLALVLMRQKRASEAQEIAMASAETFRSLHIHREVLTALLFLRQALDLGPAGVDLLEDVINFLRRTQYDPKTRFDLKPL